MKPIQFTILALVVTLIPSLATAQLLDISVGRASSAEVGLIVDGEITNRVENTEIENGIGDIQLEVGATHLPTECSASQNSFVSVSEEKISVFGSLSIERSQPEVSVRRYFHTWSTVDIRFTVEAGCRYRFFGTRGNAGSGHLVFHNYVTGTKTWHHINEMNFDYSGEISELGLYSLQVAFSGLHASESEEAVSSDLFFDLELVADDAVVSTEASSWGNLKALYR